MSYCPSTPFSDYLQIEQSKYPEITLDDIQTLKDSLADDETLPIISDKTYLVFLHSCHFDIKLAKKTIKKFYDYHFKIPQVFIDLDPFSEDIENNYKCVSIGQMPTSNTDKGDRILYLQFKDCNPAMLDFVPLFKYLVMWMDYTLLKQGTCDGIVVVIDSKGLSWRHVIKIPVGLSGQLLKFLELGLPVRLKAIHILNTGSATQMLLKLIQRFARQELIEKIKTYPVGSEDVFNYVPKKIMPLEIGGLGQSHNYFNDKLYENIIDIRDVYLEKSEVLNNHMMYMNQHSIEDDSA